MKPYYLFLLLFIPIVFLSGQTPAVTTISSPDYSSDVSEYFNGPDGADGKNGKDGLPVKPNTLGLKGQNGADGENGLDGQEIEVYVQLTNDAAMKKDLLLVYIKSSDSNALTNHSFDIIDPSKARIYIYANGGRGGFGGKGGKGSDGWVGGDGGNGGNGGNGGVGGKITVRFDPAAVKYSSSIIFVNKGGEGGKGQLGGWGGTSDPANANVYPLKGKCGNKGKDGQNGPVPEVVNNPVSLDLKAIIGK